MAVVHADGSKSFFFFFFFFRFLGYPSRRSFFLLGLVVLGVLRYHLLAAGLVFSLAGPGASGDGWVCATMACIITSYNDISVGSGFEKFLLSLVFINMTNLI